MQNVLLMASDLRIRQRLKIGLPLLFLLLFLSACSVAKHQNWEFIQSTGGLKIEYSSAAGFVISGDVSGLKAFSDRPVVVRADLAVASVETQVEGKNVKVFVRTTKKGSTHQSSKIEIRNLPTAANFRDYNFFYLNADGTVEPLKKIILLD